MQEVASEPTDLVDEMIEVFKEHSHHGELTDIGYFYLQVKLMSVDEDDRGDLYTTFLHRMNKLGIYYDPADFARKETMH